MRIVYKEFSSLRSAEQGSRTLCVCVAVGLTLNWTLPAALTEEEGLLLFPSSQANTPSTHFVISCFLYIIISFD
jgi:hypothetical protein